jgi:hypothetical protein
MKVSELNKIIDEIVTKKVKNTIIKESEEEKGTAHQVYHISCEGEPVATFKTEEEAREHLNIYKKNHPGKQFIIEKKAYQSHDHMLDELDSQGEKLENMENQKSMEEMLKGGQTKIDANKDGKITGDDFDILRGDKSDANENTEEDMDESDCESCDQGGNPIGVSEEEGEHVCSECGGSLMENGQCNECGMNMYEDAKDGDDQYHHLPADEQPVSEGHMCDECYGALDENMQCTECGKMMGANDSQFMTSGVKYPVNESKKRTIRLTESEMLALIRKVVKESVTGVPGITITDKSKKGSKKENDSHIKDVEKKMKDYLSFEGNDNPEFPHQVGGKAKKVARQNSEEQDEEVAKNKANPLNLTYDIEPSKQFKERMEMSINGDSKMGNAPTTEKANIKPSNGADKGEETKDAEGNVIKTPETGKKIKKQMSDRDKDMKDRELYRKQAVPVAKKKDTVNESKLNFSGVISEEVQKMKNLFNYNKKTQ